MADLYFERLYDIVCKGKNPDISHRKLLEHLYDTEFIYFIDKDANRAQDGIDLRWRFRDTPAPEDKPCSVFEMMVALAIRCEESIMDNPAIGDRTAQWFWGMICSLGLNGMRDDQYDYDLVEEKITKFLYREYEPNGKGGLFTIRNCDRDLRNVEIWIQLLWYLDTIT